MVSHDMRHDASEEMMELIQGSGRPDKGYYVNERRVPSVTTIIGSCKSEDTTKALMHWAWKLGKEGVDYKEKQKSAIGAGHIAHELAEKFVRRLAVEQRQHPDKDYEELVYDVESYIKMLRPADVDPSELKKALTALEGFTEWISMSRAVVIATEVPLVSEAHLVGGTLDAVIQVNDKFYIGDWKTSNSLYADYLCQIAAYKLLWEENHPQYPIDGGFHLVRFDKEYGDFEHRFFKQLTAELEAFLHMRELYGLMRKVERRVR